MHATAYVNAAVTPTATAGPQPVLALDDVCPRCGHYGPGMGMVGGELPDGTQVHEICAICEERAIVTTIVRTGRGRMAA